MVATIDQTLRWWADQLADSRAIVAGQDTITFSQLEQWTARFALSLLKRGVRSGDRVAIYAANSVNWCAAAIGIVRAGAIVLPLNYRYTTEEVLSVIRDGDPCLILIDGEKQIPADAGYALWDIHDVGLLRQGDAVELGSFCNVDDTIVIAYTSGSTAQPKGVMFSHRAMISYASEIILNYPEHCPGATAINVAPLYTGGGIVNLMQFLNLGITHFLECDFDAARALDLLKREKIAIFSGVPTFWERISALPEFNDANLSDLKFAAVDGARVPLSLLQAWREKGVILRQLYGLTEVGGASSVMPAEEATEHPEQCGRGGIFTEHRIVDENGEDVPNGSPGEILVRGPAIMTGYWNNPEATRQAFFGDWLRSGDIGVMDEKGNFQLVDRLKDIIISGGLNIWPLDIEMTISQMEGVVEVAVIGARDDKFGETPLAIIFADRDLSAIDVVSFCETRLSNYKVPRYIVIEDKPLPRLATGKISKRDLKAKYAQAHLSLQRVR